MDLKQKALQFHQSLYAQNIQQIPFQASDGWLQGWLARHDKTYSRVTTTGRDLPNNYMQLIAAFLTNTIENFRSTNWNRSKIYNIDETSIYLDCPSRYTFADKGAKRVKIDTNGAEMVPMAAADLDEEEDILGLDNVDQIDLQEIMLEDAVQVTAPEESTGIFQLETVQILVKFHQINISI